MKRHPSVESAGMYARGHLLKRELYEALSQNLARELEKRGVSEDEVLKDFEASPRKPRATRRRR